MAKKHEVFSAKAIKSYPKSYARQNGQPLDIDQVWYPAYVDTTTPGWDVKSADDAATNENIVSKTGYERAAHFATTASAYVGQIITVITEELDFGNPSVNGGSAGVELISNTAATAYIITDEDGTLEEIGSAKLESRVETLESTVGNEATAEKAATGLIKEVEDIKDAVGKFSSTDGIDATGLSKDIEDLRQGVAEAKERSASIGTPKGAEIEQYSITYNPGLETLLIKNLGDIKTYNTVSYTDAKPLANKPAYYAESSTSRELSNLIVLKATEPYAGASWISGVNFVHARPANLMYIEAIENKHWSGRWDKVKYYFWQDCDGSYAVLRDINKVGSTFTGVDASGNTVTNAMCGAVVANHVVTCEVKTVTINKQAIEYLEATLQTAHTDKKRYNQKGFKFFFAPEDSLADFITYAETNDLAKDNKGLNNSENQGLEGGELTNKIYAYPISKSITTLANSWTPTYDRIDTIGTINTNQRFITYKDSTGYYIIQQSSTAEVQRYETAPVVDGLFEFYGKYYRLHDTLKEGTEVSKIIPNRPDKLISEFNLTEALKGNGNLALKAPMCTTPMSGPSSFFGVDPATEWVTETELGNFSYKQNNVVTYADGGYHLPRVNPIGDYQTRKIESSWMYLDDGTKIQVPEVYLSGKKITLHPESPIDANQYTNMYVQFAIIRRWRTANKDNTAWEGNSPRIFYRSILEKSNGSKVKNWSYFHEIITSENFSDKVATEIQNYVDNNFIPTITDVYGAIDQYVEDNQISNTASVNTAINTAITNSLEDFYNTRQLVDNTLLNTHVQTINTSIAALDAKIEELKKNEVVSQDNLLASFSLSRDTSSLLESENCLNTLGSTGFSSGLEGLLGTGHRLVIYHSVSYNYMIPSEYIITDRFTFTADTLNSLANGAIISIPATAVDTATGSSYGTDDISFPEDLNTTTILDRDNTATTRYAYAQRKNSTYSRTTLQIGIVGSGYFEFAWGGNNMLASEATGNKLYILD